MEKHDFFSIQNVGDYVDEFFDAVVTGYVVGTLTLVVFQTKRPYKKHKCFFVDARKFDRILVEMYHFSPCQLEFIHLGDIFNVLGIQLKPRTYWT